MPRLHRPSRTTGADVALSSGLTIVAAGSLVLLATAPQSGMSVIATVASLGIVFGVLVMTSAVAHVRQDRIRLVASTRHRDFGPTLTFSTSGESATLPSSPPCGALRRQSVLIWVDRPALPPG